MATTAPGPAAAAAAPPKRPNGTYASRHGSDPILLVDVSDDNCVPDLSSLRMLPSKPESQGRIFQFEYTYRFPNGQEERNVLVLGPMFFYNDKGQRENVKLKEVYGFHERLVDEKTKTEGRYTLAFGGRPAINGNAAPFIKREEVKKDKKARSGGGENGEQEQEEEEEATVQGRIIRAKFPIIELDGLSTLERRAFKVIQAFEARMLEIFVVETGVYEGKYWRAVRQGEKADSPYSLKLNIPDKYVKQKQPDGKTIMVPQVSADRDLDVKIDVYTGKNKLMAFKEFKLISKGALVCPYIKFTGVFSSTSSTSVRKTVAAILLSEPGVSPDPANRQAPELSDDALGDVDPFEGMRRAEAAAAAAAAEAAAEAAAAKTKMPEASPPPSPTHVVVASTVVDAGGPDEQSNPHSTDGEDEAAETEHAAQVEREYKQRQQAEDNGDHEGQDNNNTEESDAIVDESYAQKENVVQG